MIITYFPLFSLYIIKTSKILTPFLYINLKKYTNFPMQIDRIRISNFKSIQELDLNFQEMNGLWEISGVVGAGKTTIGEAIIFSLFGNVRGKANCDLITWGRKHTLVEAWVYCKNHHIHIRREINSYGQSPLTATVDGEEVLGSDKRSIQGILENEWYDISRQSLELLCVISFNNFKSMSTLNAQDSRDFLNSTIAFDRLEMYENYCKDRIRENTDRITKYEKDKQYYIGALKALEDTQPTQPQYKSKDMVQARMKELTEERDALQKEFFSKRKELDKVWKVKRDQWTVAATEGKQLRQNLKKVSSGICPLCGQPVTPEHMQELDDQIKAKDDLASLLEKETESSAKVVEDYENETNPKIMAIDSKINWFRQEMAKTENWLKQVSTLKKKKEEYTRNIEVFEAGIKECQGYVAQWKEMQDFMRDTVRPTIVASIIPNINRHISYYMAQAHQNYVVWFDENFKCLMNNPYGEAIPISSLSTGQKKIIDMIIILAFIKTFITQIDFNIYFMDELIGNIDADLRDVMCGLLRNTLDERDVMFLISHSSINQEYLNGIIKVSRTAGISDYQVMNITK